MPTKGNVPSAMIRTPDAWQRFLRQSRTSKRLMTVAEVAVFLHLTPKTVRRLIHDGELQGIRVGQIAGGGRYRIPVSSVAAFLTRRSTRDELSA